MMQGIWSLGSDLTIYHDTALLIVLEEQKSIYDTRKLMLVQATATFYFVHECEEVSLFYPLFF